MLQIAMVVQTFFPDCLLPEQAIGGWLFGMFCRECSAKIAGEEWSG
jgi:hypothetical protein